MTESPFTFYRDRDGTTARHVTTPEPAQRRSLRPALRFSSIGAVQRPRRNVSPGVVWGSEVRRAEGRRAV